MRAPIRLGRLFGIDVAFDQSWLLLFALMCTNLTVVFRHWHPAWPLGGCIALALVAALLFFSSVIAHEFSHALVARRFDVTVREIRLFLFGGVASCEREPGSARAEFCIAIAGPIMSFFLGVAFLALVIIRPSFPKGRGCSQRPSGRGGRPGEKDQRGGVPKRASRWALAGAASRCGRLTFAQPAS